MDKRKKKKRRKSLIIAAILAIFFIVLSLGDFNMNLTAAEKNRTYDSLAELNEQNAVSMRYKLEKYFSTLEYASNLIREMTLSSETTQRVLDNTFPEEVSEFSYLKILDENGRSVGDSRDYSSENYFLEGMKGKRYIASMAALGRSTVQLSVPVYDADHNKVTGVLCGGFPGKNLDIFNEIDRKQDKRNIYITDSDGNYIMKIAGEDKSGFNLFKDLESEELSVLLGRIETQLQSGSSAHFEIYGTSSSERVAVVTPVKNYNLYIAVTVKGKDITRESGIYQKPVILLTVKIVLAVMILGGVYLFFQAEDKKYVRNLNQTLLMNQETYRITAQSSDICIFTYDVDTEQVEFINDKYKDLGLDQAQLNVPVLLKKIKQINPDTCAVLEEMLKTAEDGKASGEGKFTVHIEAKLRYFSISVTNLFDETGKVSRMVGKIEDITANELNMRKLRKEVGFRNTLLADCMGYMIVDVNKDCILDCTYSIVSKESMDSYTYTQLLETYLSKRVQPVFWNQITSKLSREGLMRQFEKQVYKDSCEYLTSDSSGEEKWTSCEIHLEQSKENQDVVAYLVFRNIDDSKRKQQNLEKMAEIDLLTNTWNRSAGTKRIENILNTAPSEGCVHVFAISDLDNFKSLNDKFGHMWGDKALYETVLIMKEHCRSQDVICRLGGDEFIIFLCNIPYDVVEKNISILSRKLHITYTKSEENIQISASMGAVVTNRAGCTFKELYEGADSCLYKVKRSSKGSYYISDKIY